MPQRVKLASPRKRAGARADVLAKMQTPRSLSGATATPLFSSCGCTGGVVEMSLHIAQRCCKKVVAWTLAFLMHNPPLQESSSAPRLKSLHSNGCFRHILRKHPPHARLCFQGCCMLPLCLLGLLTCQQVGLCKWFEYHPVFFRTCRHCCTHSRNCGLQESPAPRPACRLRSQNRCAGTPVAWDAT